MTPRSGSSFLCSALKSTGKMGHPEEYYTSSDLSELNRRYDAESSAILQDRILEQGTTPNGRFGVKLSTGGGGFERMIEVLMGSAYESGLWIDRQRSDQLRGKIEKTFPGLQLVFLTRRNKVRQAVSWWKAVQSGQWVLYAGQERAAITDLDYNFDAINQLVQETVLREAGWQAFFEWVGITPHTVVYEDLVAGFKPVMRDLLDAMGISDVAVPQKKQRTIRQADDRSEEWVQRYRSDKQRAWSNIGW